MTTPYGIPSIYNVGSFPFPLPKMGSLTNEEANYMEDEVREMDLKRLEVLESFATAIADSEKCSLEEAIASVTKLMDNPNAENESEALRLMVFSIKYRDRLTDMRRSIDPTKIATRQTSLIAQMILRSRLSAQWLVENLKRINGDFRLSIDPKEASELLAIPEEEWMTNGKRKEIMTRICDKLPRTELRELAGFALAEEREWKDLPEELISEQEDPSTKKYLNGYELIVMDSQEPENTTSTLTTESSPSVSQTQGSMADPSIDNPDTLLEKSAPKSRSKKN